MKGPPPRTPGNVPVNIHTIPFKQLPDFRLTSVYLVIVGAIDYRIDVAAKNIYNKIPDYFMDSL